MPAGAATVATILHADLDAFYASVEQLLDPTLRGRAIAVGGGPGGGVVLAASYQARVCGVHAGMPGWMARQLCPNLQFVAGHFHEYQRLADRVMAVWLDFTPWVERVSIDEAFLEVAGAVHLFGPPARIATAIRDRVQTEIGLALSVGVARTKGLAKVASQVAKPDGLVVVEPDRERKFLEPLPVGLISGVGPVTRAELAAIGLRTIGDLYRAQSPILAHLLGESPPGAAQPGSARPHPAGRAKSMGAQAALGTRLATPALVRDTLGYLADRVGGRLRAAERAGRTVTVRVRFAHLRSVTRSLTLAGAVSTTLTLTEVAAQLALSALDDHPRERHISLLGLSVSNLVDQPALQLELALDLDGNDLRPGAAVGAGRWAVDRSMDAIRAKFGRGSVGYAPVVLSHEDRVPEEFRSLAERG